MSEANTLVEPDFVSVGRAKRERLSHGCEQFSIYGLTIQIYDADNSTHELKEALKELEEVDG
jgi:hypothetical protein